MGEGGDQKMTSSSAWGHSRDRRFCLNHSYTLTSYVAVGKLLSLAGLSFLHV